MAKQPNEVSGAYPFYANRYIQYGQGAFVGNETNVLVKTNLTAIDAGIITETDTSAIALGTDAAVNDTYTIERTVTSGSFPVHRSTQSALNLSAPSFSYFIIGNVDATD